VWRWATETDRSIATVRSKTRRSAPARTTVIMSGRIGGGATETTRRVGLGRRVVAREDGGKDAVDGVTRPPTGTSAGIFVVIVRTIGDGLGGVLEAATAGVPARRAYRARSETTGGNATAVDGKAMDGVHRRSCRRVSRATDRPTVSTREIVWLASGAAVRAPAGGRRRPDGAANVGGAIAIAGGRTCTAPPTCVTSRCR